MTYWEHRTLRTLTKEMMETRPPKLSPTTRIPSNSPNRETEIYHTPILSRKVSGSLPIR